MQDRSRVEDRVDGRVVVGAYMASVNGLVRRKAWNIGETGSYTSFSQPVHRVDLCLRITVAHIALVASRLFLILNRTVQSEGGAAVASLLILCFPSFYG